MFIFTISNRFLDTWATYILHWNSNCLKQIVKKMNTLRTELPRASQYEMLQKKVRLKQSILPNRDLTWVEVPFFLPVACSPEPVIKGSCLHLLLA